MLIVLGGQVLVLQSAFVSGLILFVLIIPATQMTILSTLTSTFLSNRIQEISIAVIRNLTDDEIQSRIGNNESHVEEVVTKLALQVIRTSNEGQANEAIDMLSEEIESNPRGDVSLSIIWFAKQLSEGNTVEVNEILSRTSPPPEEVCRETSKFQLLTICLA